MKKSQRLVTENTTPLQFQVDAEPDITILELASAKKKKLIQVGSALAVNILLAFYVCLYYLMPFYVQCIISI